MYKVLIVDDEVFILEGLKSIIPWKDLNLEVVETAENGEEALEKYKKSDIDIVVTDITMPKMNGLQLIKSIKEIGGRCKFIILSGYDDFNYAREALRLGIENYILKPINEEELKETLENIVEKFNFQKPLTENNSDIIKENILYRWVQNNISFYELEERGNILNINLKYDYYEAAIIKIEHSFLKCKEVLSYVKGYERDTGFYSFLDTFSNVICIYGRNNKEKCIKDILKKVKSGLSESLKVKVFITIGSSQSSYKTLHKSYEEAKEIQKYLLLYGYSNIKAKEDIENLDVSIEDAPLLEEFNKTLIKKEKTKVKENLEDIFNKLYSLKGIKPEAVQNVAIKILLAIIKMKEDFNIVNDSEEESIKDLILNICEVHTREELLNVLLNRCNKLIEDINETSSNLSPVIKQVVSYIKNNFGEEMSLKTLSYKYNINSSYLGQIFLKEVGEPFNDYLNRIRNEEARNLILNTNLRIIDISQKVGYSDTSYFYRKFKAYYGLSPNKLRENKTY